MVRSVYPHAGISGLDWLLEPQMTPVSPVESWVVVEGNRLPVDEIHDSTVAGPWEWMGGTQYCGMRVVVG